MPLPLTGNSLDQLPEAWRSEYLPRGDGKFEINLVGGLMSALRKERAFRASVWKLSEKAPKLRAVLIEIESKIKAQSTTPTPPKMESPT